jgi:hypothetical protein
VIGEPAAIDFGSGPAPAAASADRWRGWSVQQQTRSGQPDRHRGATSTGAVDRAGDVDLDAGNTGDASGNDGRSGAAHRLRARLRSDPAARAALLTRAPVVPAEADRPPRPSPLAKVAIALLSGLLLTLAAVQVIAWATGLDDPLGSSVADQPMDPAQWAAVVGRLDDARGAALAAADPGLLAEVYTDDSAQRSADAATIEQLATRGWHVADAVHRISTVTLLDPPADGAPADQVRLGVVDDLPARPIVDGAGQQVGMTPARAEQRRILTVSRTDAGYRISNIEPG